ncbi:MAG: polyphosphate kinase 2 [Pseudomonadota bacterium]
MAQKEDEQRQVGWVASDIQDSFDEELEMEMDDDRIPEELRSITTLKPDSGLSRAEYFNSLFHLQTELVKLQDWVVHTGYKLVVIFEGRDSAGKGGAIKRITQRLNPRICRVAALPAPNEREKSQWYFQRFVSHLPAGGEIVLFDRSWYNRAGVERVMGFATEEEIDQFFHDVPEFERMLVRSGIKLIKYWFSITDEEQQLRFLVRMHDPMKQWKLSPMDLQARVRWEDYTEAKEDMLQRTNIAEAPWYIVEANDKKRARLNCIDHMLSHVPYTDVPYEPPELPERVFNPDYERSVMPEELYVPKKY